MDGRVMRRGIIGSCQSAATSKIVKALLVTSLTHVSSAIASTRPLLLPFTHIMADNSSQQNFDNDGLEFTSPNSSPLLVVVEMEDPTISGLADWGRVE